MMTLVDLEKTIMSFELFDVCLHRVFILLQPEQIAHMQSVNYDLNFRRRMHSHLKISQFK